MPLPLRADAFNNILTIADTLSSKKVRDEFTKFMAAYNQLALDYPQTHIDKTARLTMAQVYDTVLTVSRELRSKTTTVRHRKNIGASNLIKAQEAIAELQPFFKTSIDKLQYLFVAGEVKPIDASVLILLRSQMEQLSINLEARREQLMHRTELLSLS